MKRGMSALCQITLEKEGCLHANAQASFFSVQCTEQLMQAAARTVVLIFFSMMRSYFCRFVCAARPCHGSDLRA
jgi:hypothetical protein